MAKKKTKNNLGKTLLAFLSVVISALTSIALFTNVWVWKTVSKSGETLKNVGGYFEDLESYETLFEIADKKLPVFGTKLAGASVIVALVFTAVLLICTILKMLNKSNKTVALVSKISSILIVLAGLIALTGSLIFVVPEIGSTITSSMTMAFGAIAGFLFPILGGVLGFIANK